MLLSISIITINAVAVVILIAWVCEKIVSLLIAIIVLITKLNVL